MRGGRTTALVLLALLLPGLCTVILAVEGTVLDENQKPIEGARVCYFVDKVELFCSLSDANGRYELPSSEVDTIRAHAKGYNPKIFSAAAQHRPVTLQRAPALRVRLVDRTGKPLPKGELLISYPSGKELGPFPVNRAGLQIRRGLNPGEIRVIGMADGFRRSDPVAVTLEAGEEAVVTIEMLSIKPAESK